MGNSSAKMSESESRMGVEIMTSEFEEELYPTGYEVNMRTMDSVTDMVAEELFAQMTPAEREVVAKAIKK